MATDLREHQTTLLGLLVLFIAAVSVHDAHLVILNHLVIMEVEKNPVGWWLVSATGGEVWPFITIKLACTAVVCATLLTMFDRAPRITLPVATGIASFQAALLLYLTVF